ncbi:MAG: FAD-binding protein [Mitsuaria chitosanitabida]|uniref:FAD-dependent oxidoreductase n=1 Tax=Roseateles chitosanitabidus TaxID=65048 RepID=UPI001B19E3FA|nr:FAD-dependent oxidoreductase [Roseateles chitosanitabidus]MBO9686256.1 FAD-binding protein [Roseateles chitosanitabidus]
MDRRRFLAAGMGVLAGSWTAGCGGGGGSPGAPVTPVPPTQGVSDAELATLAAQMQGRLILPADADFGTLRPGANARYDGAVPRALARCAGGADVAAAFAFARSKGMSFALRSGSHSYVGASTSDGGLLIDTGTMDSVRMDGTVAVVGAGAKLADVYRAVLGAGRILPSGSCVTVGVTGITLGGGVGYFDRSMGLACDALIGATVITADGQTRVCDATQNTELFWGLRGGGGGQFGIVTELRFQTQPMGALSGSIAYFTAADLPALLAAWQSWPATLPEWAWSQLAIASDAKGDLAITLIGIALATNAQFKPWWDGLLAASGRTPQNQFSADMTGESLLLANCGTLSNAACHLPTQVVGGVLPRVAMVASSDFYHQTLPAAGIQALTDAMVARSKAGRPGAALLDLMGGAIARVAPDATAFPHRNALFGAQYVVENRLGTADEATLHADGLWAQSMRDTMKPWTSGGAYVNYANADAALPASAYFGGNVTRLRALKASIDPAGVFKSPRGPVSLG